VNDGLDPGHVAILLAAAAALATAGRCCSSGDLR